MENIISVYYYVITISLFNNLKIFLLMFLDD